MAKVKKNTKTAKALSIRKPRLEEEESSFPSR